MAGVKAHFAGVPSAELDLSLTVLATMFATPPTQPTTKCFPPRDQGWCSSGLDSDAAMREHGGTEAERQPGDPPDSVRAVAAVLRSRWASEEGSAGGEAAGRFCRCWPARCWLDEGSSGSSLIPGRNLGLCEIFRKLA